MTNYEVHEFAEFDDFSEYVESLATTTDIQFIYSPDRGYIVVVG